MDSPYPFKFGLNIRILNFHDYIFLYTNDVIK